jgi:glycosyltransferase involved in cell wall biosynthesis
VNVHQILSGAGPHDAVTTEARAFRARFQSWGWGGTDVSARIAPGLNGAFSPLRSLAADPADLLLFHHSASTPGLGELLELPNRKLLLYHNVTPPEWLWEHAPVVAAQCALGREQLSELVAAVDLAAADSNFNAAELSALGAEQTEVIPLLLDHSRLGSPDDGKAVAPDRAPTPDRAPRPDRAPTILFVGRLSPHKRQDRVIEAFALLRRHRWPDARLVLVGDPVSRGYAGELSALGDRLAPGAVTIETGLPAPELGQRYRAADVFLCLSEHEGFCVPVLEAMYFGVPVLARAAGAVPEVAGDGALLIEDDDPALVSELLHLILTDAELAQELRSRGRGRVDVYAPDRVAERLRAVVLAAGDGVQD